MSTEPREIPLYTLAGVPDAEIEHHTFETDDKLGLSMVRFHRGAGGDAVLVAHGLTTSTDMFVMPEHENLVTHLLDRGYDVWCFDYRMSNRHSYNLFKTRFTMDDVALYDFPAALRVVREHVGEETAVHVIGHCLGALCFLMSLVGGASTGITSVIANSVALTPRVPTWSRVKLTVAPTVVESVLGLPYINPAWSRDPGLSRGKLFAKAVSAFHRECDVPACHMLSLMWGTGWPALYSHETMAEVTHRRSADLFGATSMHYYRHVRKMVAAGRAVKMDPDNPAHAALPDDYLEAARFVTTPILFTAGDRNRVFTDSNVVCHRELEKRTPGLHRLEILPGYGHQDAFMGKHAARDVFPVFDRFLAEHRGRPAAAASGPAGVPTQSRGGPADRATAAGEQAPA